VFRSLDETDTFFGDAFQSGVESKDGGAGCQFCCLRRGVDYEMD